MEDKINWQVKSQARGFKLLGFTLPVFLITFIASSQLPRSVPQSLFTKTSDDHIIVDSFRTHAKGTKVQLFLTTIPQKSQKVRIKYQIKYKGDVFRSRKLTVNVRGGEIGIDDPFSLPEKGRYSIGASLGKKSFSKLGIKSWTLRIIANPSSTESKILRYLEVLIIPSFCLILLALVLIFVPKFISR